MSTRDGRWPQGTPNWVDLSSPDVVLPFDDDARAEPAWAADA